MIGHTQIICMLSRSFKSFEGTTAKKKVGTKSVIRNAPTEYRQPVCTEILEFPYNRLLATLIEIPATTDTFPLTTDFLKIRQSDVTYYRHHTDLLPTKYRLFQKN